MKNCLIIFLAAIALTFRVVAEPDALVNRWGKGSFISESSSTLNSVKPLANWIWDSGADNPKNY